MSGYDKEDDDREEPSPPPAPFKRPNKTPQASIAAFWDAFDHKYPGKIHQILPVNPYAELKSASEPKGVVVGHPARQSYEEAKADCIAAVEKIAKECRRCNLRYRDPHFDIEWDLKSKYIPDCLYPLHAPALKRNPTTGEQQPPAPRAVKRVYQIFQKPEFYIDGATAFDIRQGIAGDCWFLAALGALGNKKGLIERVCVARDEQVGVYGFLFHRDGEWTTTIIDDTLYLMHADWEESYHEKNEWSKVGNRNDPEEEYRQAFQVGSRALFFAQCTLENETWLPLLEKAFAKAHGDYDSIDGGYTGEAIEDLTGGVTTELFTSDILDLEKFWTEELCQVNQQFLFGCSTGRFDNWQGYQNNTDRKGIQSCHAYSIMEVREVKGIRLLKIRNPWGEAEWSGPWSDGSAEWNAEWMGLLNHTFGDDGVFWISYKDWLRKYNFLHRTRLFDSSWKVTQQWTSIQVPWYADYKGTKFTFELTEAGRVTIVLSQLDDRYWTDFKGQYTFTLHFRINRSGEEDYIVRSHGNYSMRRSVNTEVELEAGNYDVRIKIAAVRRSNLDTIGDVVKNSVRSRPDKLLQVALSYDTAHAKGNVIETEEEKQHRAEKEAKDTAAAKEKARASAKEKKRQSWLLNKKRIERYRRATQRRKAHHDDKAANAQPEWEDEPDNKEEANNNQSPRRGPNQFPDPLEDLPGGYEEEDYTNRLSPQDRIDTFNQDPAFQSRRQASPRGDNYNDFPDDQDQYDMPPGPRRPPSAGADTIYTFNSSVDSELDEHLFEPDTNANDPAVYLDDEIDTDLESFAGNPWNAVCVVGLRIFTRNGDASIKVVRPGDEIATATAAAVAAGETEAVTAAKNEERVPGSDVVPLDVDDQARGVNEDFGIAAPDDEDIAQEEERRFVLPLREGYQRGRGGDDGRGRRGWRSRGGGRRHGRRH